jgi:hypothetical protein
VVLLLLLLLLLLQYWRLAGMAVDLLAGSGDGVIPPGNVRYHYRQMQSQGLQVRFCGGTVLTAKQSTGTCTATRTAPAELLTSWTA